MANTSATGTPPLTSEPSVLYKGAGLSFEWVNKNPLKTVALVDGLRKVGLLASGEVLEKYEDLREWTQSGESYTATAQLETNQKTLTVFAKCCVSFGGSTSRFTELMKRRQALIDLGIRVPFQFSKDNTASYEEYIEHDLRDVKHKLPQQAKIELSQVAGRLDEAGYCPLGFLRDMRVSSCLQKVYYVDFGFDLGGPEARFKHSDKHTPCLNQLKKDFHGEDITMMTDSYWKERKSKTI